MSDLETTIDYYKDLTLYQYINKPKATETIKLLARQAMVDFLPIDVNNAFDIDTAIGSQLDILGEYIGLDRVIETAIVRDYFTFQDMGNYLATIYGLTDYNSLTLNATASFYNYINSLGISSSLADEEYRILLKLKLHTNISSHSLYDIASILHEYFGHDLVLVDMCDMTIAYLVNSSISRIITIAYNENLLPKPMGVTIIGLWIMDNWADVWAIVSQFDGNTAVGAFTDYNGYFMTLLDDQTGQESFISLDVTNESVGSLFPIGAVRSAVATISLELSERVYNTTVGDIVCEIWATSNGLPTGNALASVTVHVADLNNAGITVIDFSSSVVYLTANTNYAFTLRTDVDSSFFYSQGSGAGKYSGLLRKNYYVTDEGGTWMNTYWATIANAHMNFSMQLNMDPALVDPSLGNANDKIFLNYEGRL